MREQPSKRAIELRLEWLNKALGRPLEAWTGTAPNRKATNAFYIDHNIGGYRLECAGHAPFGHQRMSKRELCGQLEAILVAIKLARNEESGAAWPSECTERVNQKLAGEACKAALQWAAAPGNHGGNPYTLPFVRLAERALAGSGVAS